MSKRGPRLYYASVIALTMIQLFMGADPIVVFFLTLISCFAYFVFSTRQAMVSDVIFFATLLYTGPFTLVVKTILMQPVDENLGAPIESSLVNFIGFLSIFVGYLAARKVNYVTHFAATLSERLRRMETLALCGKLFFPIGVTFDLLHIALRPQATQVSVDSGEGIGFFGTFTFITTFAVICQAALVFSPDNPSRKGFSILTGMLAVVMVLSIAGNVKATFLISILAIILIILMGSAKVVIYREAIIGGVMAAVLIFYVSPAIHITRSQIGSLSITERLEAALTVMEKADFDPFVLANQEQDKILTYASTRDPRLNYLFPSSTNLGRFCIIQPVDQVVSRYPFFGGMGGEVFSDILPTVLPSFLVAKEAASSPDFIAWHYRIRDPGIVGRPVIGLTASAFAAGAYLGVIIIPGVVMFIAFVVLNAFSGPIRDNPLAIFIAISSLLLAEKEASQVIIFLVRQLPFSLIFLYLVKAYLLNDKSTAQLLPRGRLPRQKLP